MAEPIDPRRRERIARAVRVAMQAPDRYLAAWVAEETDESLAAQVGGDPERIWRLRLAQYPRPAYWDHDVRLLAATIHGDPALLDAYLRRLGLGPQG